MLPNSFVLYKPKDIVSGDFYWLEQRKDKVLFSAIDCTGHGVPGAFMSIVGYNNLKLVVENNGVSSPGKILDELNKSVSETLHHGHDEYQTKDGMDLALCSIDYQNMELEFAGAYNPLYLFRDGELIQTKGDKLPIGFFLGEEKQSFQRPQKGTKSGHDAGLE